MQTLRACKKWRDLHVHAIHSQIYRKHEEMLKSHHQTKEKVKAALDEVKGKKREKMK